MDGGKLSKIERTNIHFTIFKNVFGKVKQKKISDFLKMGLNLGMPTWSGQEVRLFILAWQFFLICGFKECPESSFKSFEKKNQIS